MKALVTGGAGFIGSHLTERLVADGHRVTVLDNFSTGRHENLAPVARKVELLEGDVRDRATVAAATAGCEVVFHQAARPSVERSIRDPVTTSTTNVNGTLSVLVAARDQGVRRTVVASSSSVYGAGGELPNREHHRPAPASPYAASKLAAEAYCHAFWNAYRLPSVCLRYFNVFGPRQDPASQYAAVVPRFIDAALAGQAATIYGDGRQSRDFTYIDNVVHANVLAAGCEAAGVVVNVACGERREVLALARQVADLTGARTVPRHEPGRAGEVRHSLADVSLARELLGYQPTVGFDEGLAQTVGERSHEELAATA